MDDDETSDIEEDIYRTKRPGKKSSKSKKQSSKESSVSKDVSKSRSATNTEQQPTVWDLAVTEAAKQSDSSDGQVDERSILFIGSKDAGKSSIVLRCLDRDETPKPTTALEYTFGRRARGSNLDKDVAHFWELGGGTKLSKLADLTITADSLRHLSLALVVDLSKPEELWLTVEQWLEVIKARVVAVIDEARSKDQSLKDRLRQSAWQRVGEDHEDRELLNPILIPFVIIGSKYDVFQDFDPEARKIICRTLRFVAHSNGAHLQFFSTRHEALLSRTRSVVSHLVFATPLSKCLHEDHNKPLSITAGSDSFQHIGSPPLPEGDLGRVMAKTPLDLWKHAFVSKFPQQNVAGASVTDDPAKDKQFAEPAIDAVRAQKDEELERYRRTSERRMKEALNKSLADGFVY